LAVALIIVVGGLFFYFKPSSDNGTDTVATVTRSISQPSQKVPVPKTPSSTPVRPQPIKQPPKATAPAPPVKTQPKPVMPADKPAPAPVVKKKPPAPAKKPPPAKKKTAQQRGPVTASLPVLKTELELQAISWAPAAGDRLAVINGNIVREGASLEGYVIVQIDKDEVAVQKGAEQWKLVFDLK
jgi:outer membrane biosynthesis protein TonB